MASTLCISQVPAELWVFLTVVLHGCKLIISHVHRICVWERVCVHARVCVRSHIGVFLCSVACGDGSQQFPVYLASWFPVCACNKWSLAGLMSTQPAEWVFGSTKHSIMAWCCRRCCCYRIRYTQTHSHTHTHAKLCALCNSPLTPALNYTCLAKSH